MKKLMVAIAGAVALTCSAFADATQWFDGGIAEGWPTEGEGLIGGAWTNPGDLSTYDATKDAVIVDADANAPLAFTATASKTIGDDAKNLLISSTIKFTPFEALPDVPADAKAGVIAMKDGNFWILEKDANADPATNKWTETAVATTDAAVDVSVAVDGTGKVTYTIGDTALAAVEVVSDGTFSSANYTGDGEVSALSATYESAKVAFTIADIDGATKVVTVDGEVVEYPYEGAPDADLEVVYTAAAGKIFKNGQTTYTYTGTVTEGAIDTKVSEQGLKDAPAEINGTLFYTVQAAFDAAQADETVMLCTNVTESVSVAADKSFTLDLNGKTLQNDKAYYTIDNAGTLTVVDSADTKGTITHLTADTSSTIRNLGVLTISDITVGGTYIGIKNDEGDGCNGGKGYGELTLNGVTFNGDDQAVQNWGHATINGGTFGGAVYTWAYAGNAGNVAGVTTINNGTFNEAVRAVQYWDETLGWPSPKATVTINGGTFEALVDGTYTINYTGDDPEKGVIAVPGTSSAKFKYDETAYATLESGYQFAKSGDYYVVTDTPAAKIGTTYYLTLADAFNALQDNDTIQLTADSQGATQFTCTEANVTLDLNGFTYEHDVSTTSYLLSIEGGKMTITDTTADEEGTLIKHGLATVIQVKNGAELVFEKGNLKYDGQNGDGNSGSIIAVKANSTATMNGGKVIVLNKFQQVALRSDGTLTVNGGYVDGGYKVNDPGTISLKGGVYTEDPTAYAASGYHASKEGDNWIVSTKLKWYAMVYVDGTPTTWAGLGTGDAYYNEGVQVMAEKKGVTNLLDKTYYVSKLVRKGDPDDLTCEFTYNGTALTKKGTDTLGVTIGEDGVTLSYEVTTGAPYVKDALGHACFGAIYLTKYEQTGPTPAPGNKSEVTPVGDNTYVVTPTAENTDGVVAVENVKKGDTLVVGVTVTAIGIQEGEQSGVIIKVMNSGNTAVITNDALVGWNGNSFDTALDPDKYVEIAGEEIPVTPEATTDATTPIADGAVATKTIPGLTYQLVRGDEPGDISTALETEGAKVTATTTSTTLTDTAKPETKAFYKIQVTK